MSYRERPEGGSSADTGRVLSTNGSATYGVDINSQIDIDVDVACLRQSLAPRTLAENESQRYVALKERISALALSAASIEDVVKLFAESQLAHEQAAITGDYLASQQRIKLFATQMLKLRQSLERAVEQRLLQDLADRGIVQGVDSASRTRQRAFLDAGLDSVFGPIDRVRLYDVVTFRNAFAREVELAQEALASLPDPRLTVEIQAHLVTADGETPIRLPKYNDAAVGPDRRFERLQFGVTKEQADLRLAYDSLARSMRASHNLGDALQAATRADWERVRPQVDALLANLRASLKTDSIAFRAVARWTARDALSAWLATVSVAVGQSDSGKKVLAHWRSVEALLSDVQKDAETLVALANIRVAVAGTTPEAAMNIVLAALSTVQNLAVGERLTGRALQRNAWKTRADTVVAFVQAVKALQGPMRSAFMARNGPFGAVDSLIAAARNTEVAFAGTVEEGRRWLARSFGADVARSMAALPVPPGQRRVPLTDNASTSFALRTIPVPRNVGDYVQVTYAFYADDRQLADSWHDTFRLRAFGTLSRAVAGLAFTRPQSETQWTPTASISWIVTWRKWPEENARGLGTNVRVAGFGLTTMSLNFEPEERVQIGLAGTLSMLDDRILAGYGYNLQAKQKPWYWFFSLRLFSATGALGTD